MEKSRPCGEPSSSAGTGPGLQPVENTIFPASNNRNSEKKNGEVEEGYAAVTGSSDEEADEPPDGGLLAWLQVLGCYFLFFNSWYVATNPYPNVHRGRPLPAVRRISCSQYHGPVSGTKLVAHSA